jgi:hypothetical protein
MYLSYRNGSHFCVSVAAMVSRTRHKKLHFTCMTKVRTANRSKTSKETFTLALLPLLTLICRPVVMIHPRQLFCANVVMLTREFVPCIYTPVSELVSFS